MGKTAIVFGSSRPAGNTALIAQYLGEQLDAPVFDVGRIQIAPYHYEHRYPAGDGYYALMEELVCYEHWIMLTPVYWYTMSAQLKVFWDRKSDLLRVRKDLGQALAGTQLWVMCCSSDAEPYPHFFAPFQLSAAYLKMVYRGDLHLWGGRRAALKPEVQAHLDNWIQMHYK
jgi:putative NADPH-quinone reductase